MDETPTTTTTTVCRSCLKESGEFQSVFVVSENSGCELFLADMISSCASVQITLGDGLPEQICLECVNRTVDMYLFKLQCEKSDKILRERLTVTNKQSVKELELSVNNNNENSTINSLIGEEKIIKEDIDNFVPALDDDVKLTSETVIVTENDTESEQHNITFTNEEDKFSSTQIESYECKLCPQQFERSDLLWRHQISHAIKLTEENENDETHNDSLEQLNDECMVIIKTEEDVIYTCQDCGFIFIRKDELDRHLEMHLPSVKIGKKDTVEAACQVCSKTFRQRGQLNRHMKTHITVKAHVCKTCGRSFARPEQLKNHMNVHLGSKPHICEICFKGFNQISNLKDHMRTHNGERPFLCSTCGKGFNQLGNLRQHTIRHSGIKAHLCSTCGSGFASKGELSAHLRKHTGARPFVCSICNHGFTTSSSLTKHKRIHSGEKPYECDVCKMKFSRSGILARHKRTHTGEKPYICKFCSKAFSQSNDLTSHLRIHTGEKPYICDVCGHAFRQSSGLKAHKKTHIDKQDVVDNNRRNKIITLFN